MKDVTQLARTRIPTEVGTFDLILYDSPDGKDHMAFVMGEVDPQAPVLARVHSECFTGDVMGSRRCDCGPQLSRAMAVVAEEGQGVILYMRQEGRGIGLLNKLKAYNLQDQGLDTVDANRRLGHEADERDYAIAAAIFMDLGMSSLRLMTNNPAKIEALENLGLCIVERVPLEVPPHADNRFYLNTKRERMNHIFTKGQFNGHNGSPKHTP
jgi:3,4-dihydroxy 2-butanone 4-phosphate synthase/GTP cyclohydrolase II